MKEFKFVSLLPHSISVVGEDMEITIKPSGSIARVSSTTEVVGEIGGFTVSRSTFGDVIGLPEPEEGVYYIVSGLVLSALAGTRPDVLAPDTGSSAIRDDKGHIVAVRGFLA